MNKSDIIGAINAHDGMAYIAVTGGGSQFVGDFLSHCGGSNTILGFDVPYAMEAFDDFVGFKIDKYCDEAASEHLALSAYKRAFKYTNQPVVGIGVTCALQKENERVGRRNVAVITTIDNLNEKRVRYVVDLPKIGRHKQEFLVSTIILGVLEKTLLGSVHTLDALDVEYTTDEQDCYFLDLYTGTPEYFVKLWEATKSKLEDTIIFPGSFNPFHDGHAEIMNLVSEKFGKLVVCELSISNFEKPLILPTDIYNRISSMKKYPSIITNTPLFVDKTRMLGDGLTFVVGADTMTRLLWHSPVKQTYELYERGVKFIVVDRGGVLHNGKYGYLCDLPKQVKDKANEMILDIIKYDNPISSTQIRNGK